MDTGTEGKIVSREEKGNGSSACSYCSTVTSQCYGYMAERLGRAQQRMLEAASHRDYRGRSAEEISPLSLPVAD